MDCSKNIIFLVDSESMPYNCTDTLFSENVKVIRLCVLKLLTYFSNNNKAYNDFRWSHKLFSSASGYSTSLLKIRAQLVDFSLESYEEFEDILSLKLDRLRKTLSLEIKSSTTTNQEETKFISRSKLVGTALRELLHEYDWNVPQILSPVKTSRKNTNGQNNTQESFDENFVFLFGNCPSNIGELEAFTGIRRSNDSHCCNDKILRSFLPPALLNQFLHKTKIRLFWIDTSLLFDYKVLDNSVKDQMRCILKQINGGIIPTADLIQHSLNMNGLLSADARTSCDHIFPVSTVMSAHLTRGVLHTAYENDVHESTKLIFELHENLAVVEMIIEPLFSYDNNVAGEHFRRLLAVGTVHKPSFWSSYERCHSFICLPKNDLKSLFQQLMNQLLVKKLALIVSRPGKFGLVAGVVVPVTPALAHLIVFKPKNHLKSSELDLSSVSLNDKGSLRRKSQTVASRIHQDYGHTVQNRECVVKNTDILEHSGASSSFTMSALENWFVPNHSLGCQFQKSDRVTKRKELLNRKLDQCYQPSAARVYRKTESQAKRREKGDRLTKLYKSNSGNLRLLRRSNSMMEASKRHVKDGIHNDITIKAETHFEKRLPEASKVSEGSSVEADEDVMNRLRELHADALDNNSCLLTCAQNLITILGHHTRKNYQKIMQLLNQGLMLNASQIAAKYEKHSSPEIKIREYQFQVLLLLECKLLNQSVKDECVDKVVLLLRTMSFLSGPAGLSTFLSEALFANYLSTLQPLIVEICEELSQPLPNGIASPSSSSSEENEEELESNLSSVRSDQLFSQCSTNSSLSSSSTLCLRNRYIRSQSFADYRHKRQIMVHQVAADKAKVKEPKQTSNKPNETNHEKITVRRNLFSGSPVKRKRRNSTCGTGLKSPRRIKNNPPKVVERTPKRDKINASRRKAATTPKGRHVLKTMFVPATPEHKEGSLGVLRRQQRLHRRTLSKDAHEIVEESPDKAYKAGTASSSSFEESPVKETKGFQFKTPTKSPRFKTPKKSLCGTPCRSSNSKIPSKLFDHKSPLRSPTVKTPSNLSSSKSPKASTKITVNNSPLKLNLDKTPGKSPALKIPAMMDVSKSPTKSCLRKTPIKSSSSKTPLKHSELRTSLCMDKTQLTTKKLSTRCLFKTPLKNSQQLNLDKTPVKSPSLKISATMDVSKSPTKACLRKTPIKSSSSRTPLKSSELRTTLCMDKTQPTPKKMSTRCLFKTPLKNSQQSESISEVTEAYVQESRAITVSFTDRISPTKPSPFRNRRSLRMTPDRQSRQAQTALETTSRSPDYNRNKSQTTSGSGDSSTASLSYSMNEDESFTEVFTSPSIQNSPSTIFTCEFELSPEKAGFSVHELIDKMDETSNAPDGAIGNCEPNLVNTVTKHGNTQQMKSPESSLKEWRRIKPRYGKTNGQKQNRSPSSYSDVSVMIEFPPQRITRRLAHAIGLSPETVHSLSTMSPKISNKKFKLSSTDSYASGPDSPPVAARKTSYVSPSALSLAHLTTSPMILRSKSPKKPFCRKRLIDGG